MSTSGNKIRAKYDLFQISPNPIAFISPNIRESTVYQMLIEITAQNAIQSLTYLQNLHFWRQVSALNFISKSIYDNQSGKN